MKLRLDCLQASSHIVDAFTVKKQVEKRVKELKAQMNDGGKAS